ncbi:MAG: MFS transporter [Aeromicrobium sp.]|uniref:MFS transporter n=1 Tax=Aeromicrobium sp. TaxID=1871063 RepID=UPI002618BBB8|nr:MFS transporter [Aeromicrobium sp.]MDF1704655.1 MFS transporter [Aeromicrobium sp.]
MRRSRTSSVESRPGTFAALQVRNYRIYASGGLLSNIGTWLQSTAQAWLVLELTGSGAALGFTIALQLLPSLLLSPLAGVLADRVPKRTLLRWLQLGMALPSALLGVLAIAGVVQVWQVYVLTTLFGGARALEAPARQSFVAEMVGQRHLSNAVSLNSASFNSGRLVGPALAGVLIAALGSGVFATGWVILANALSYGFVLLALQVMDPSALHPAPLTGDRRGAVRAGVRYVRSRPDLVLLFACVFFMGSFGMNFAVTTALMATEEFGKGAGEFGLLGSIMAIGSLAGALLAARRQAPRLRFIVGAALCFSALQVVSALMPTYVTYAAVLPLVGLSVLTAVTTANALIQMSTAPAMRGRVASLYLMVFLGSVPLGAPLIGWLGEAFGPRWALAASGLGVGIGVTLAAIWFMRQDAPIRDALSRRRRGRRGQPPVPAPHETIDLA